MQTFLPLSIEESPPVLDRFRLWKQVLEADQILDALRTRRGWYFHPVVQMWQCYPSALRVYRNTCLRECFKRKIRVKSRRFLKEPDSYAIPLWIPGICSSYRSNLLRKAKEGLVKNTPKAIEIYNWYNQFGWTEPLNIPYIWKKP